MPETIDKRRLAYMKLEGEIALRRAQKMVEFLRLVCQNESRILASPARSTGLETERDIGARPTVQNQQPDRCN